MDDLVPRLRDILRDRRTALLNTQAQTIAAAADRIVALEAERDRLAADNAALTRQVSELLLAWGEPSTLDELRATIDARRAAGSTDSSTP